MRQTKTIQSSQEDPKMGEGGNLADKKIALITGASTGIGALSAEYLAGMALTSC